MVSLVFAVASGITTAFVACAIKGAQNSGCRVVSFGVVSMAFAALLAFLFVPFFPGGYSLRSSGAIGVVLGILMSVAIIASVLANREGPPALVWCITNLGLIVPIIFSALFQNEPLRFSDSLLLGNFILMLWLFKKGMNTAGDFAERRHPLRYVILLIAVFLSNGFLMFGFKMNEMLYPSSNKACFVAAIYCGATMIFLSGMVCLRHTPKCFVNSCEFRWGAMMGSATVTAVLLLQMSMRLPAIVVFPITQGIALIGGVVLMFLIYRERLNNLKAAGILLGLAVLFQGIFR